jgi:hypothetical protein
MLCSCGGLVDSCAKVILDKSIVKMLLTRLKKEILLDA